MKDVKKSIKKRQLWVVKIGSQLVIDGGPLLLKSLLDQVVQLQKNGVDVIWVTSGAIATARNKMARSWKTLPEKQALSALGQPLLMELYTWGFHAVGKECAQVLLSATDFKKKRSRVNLTNTLKTLISWGVTPILNENDAVSTDEIQFGDNDFLSALVASEVGADQLVILTNVDAIYDRPPTQEGAVRFSVMEKISPSFLKKAEKFESSSMGRGGILSKLRAAKFAQSRGIPTWVVPGMSANILSEVRQQQSVGTFVPAVRRK